MQTKQYSGIIADSERVEWTILRESKTGLEIVQQEVRELPEPSEDEPAPSLPAPELKGTVYAAVPIADTLVRIMTLPATDREELVGMVELQIGKISPFPVEDLVFSFEVLETGENSSRVLIAAVRTERLEQLGAANAKPRHIDVDLMVRWHGLVEDGWADRSGRMLYLFVQPESAELIVAQDGSPILLRSLIVRGDLSWQEYRQELAEELRYTMTAIEADWEGGEETRAIAFQSDHEGQSVASELSEQEGIPVEVADIGSLTPLSEMLVRRGIERGGNCIDLVPPEWRQIERDKLVKHRLLIACVGFAVVWLAVVAAIAGYTHLEKSSLRQHEERAQELKEPAQKSRALQSRIQTLEQYADRTYSVLESLREVTELLPSNLELLSFNFKSNREVNLRGVSDSTSATEIYNYFEALEDSDKFEALEGQQVSTVDRRDRGRGSQFKVTLRIPKQGEEI